MTENELMTLLRTVTPPDESARAAAHAHWAALAKPLGGLGALETMIEDAAALTGNAAPAFERRAVLVLCADNGVVAQGVSQTDAAVTRACSKILLPAAPASAAWQQRRGVPWCRSIWELRARPWRVLLSTALPPAPAILPQDPP